MDANTELLNYIYQNASMGESATTQLAEISKDSNFREHLNTQRKEYTGIMNQAKELLHESGHEEKDIPSLTKVSAYMNIGVKTMIDNSTSRMAEMMMQGSMMGIADATKNIKRYAHADSRAVNLAHKLLNTEESNVEHIKEFLS